MDDLKHQIIEDKIKVVSNQMHKGFSDISEALQGGFAKIRDENKHYSELSAIKQTEILKRQDLTNGRVKALEKVTSLIKFMQENKKIAALIFYAIYNILEVTTIENVLSVYRWIKLVI